MKRKTNLTSGQIVFVMDTLLYDSLRDVVENTGAFDVQLVYLLRLITSNKKRRPYNSDSRERAITLIVRALAAPRDQKMKYIMELKMERNFIYVFLENLLNRHYLNYITLYRKFVCTTNPTDRATYGRKLNVIARELGAESRSDLFVALNNLNDLLPKFMEYFHSVVGDYYKLCTKQTKYYIETNGANHYDPHDVQQNFLRNVIVAVNKFDATRGTLVSYVKWWILNAQTCSSSEHEYGIAYTVPQNQRKKMATGQGTGSINFSVSLDTPSDSDDGDPETSLHNRVSNSSQLEDIVDASRQAEKLSLLVKKVDPYAMARLTMDIGEAFAPYELDKMKEYMRSNNIAF